MNDLFNSRQEAIDGANRAADHAEAVHPEWKDQAFAMFKRYANDHASFMAEDVRVWAQQQGLPHPPDPRAWGQVAKRATREGIASISGYALTKVPPAHAGPRAVYASRILGGVEVVS